MTTRTAKDVVVLLALTATMYGVNLGTAPLWDRDEPRNARCAQEMLQRQDWVVPYFNDQLRGHKPVLLYWLMMASYSVLGVSEFSARVVSAILASGTVLMTYAIALCWGTPGMARWSGVVLASSLLFTISARAATPDATLIFCCTLSILIWVWSTQTTATACPVPRNRWVLFGTYCAMGLAMLAKGPVGVILPTAVLGTYCLTENGFWSGNFRTGQPWRILWNTFLQLRPGLGLLAILLVAGPWYTWVGLRTEGAWLVEFFGEHNLGRATRAMEGHSGFLFFYPATLMAGTFPWSILTIPLLIHFVNRRKRQTSDTFSHHRPPAEQDSRRHTPCETRLVRLAWIWLIVYLITFSLARTQLPSYILPAYPAAAILFGIYLQQVFVRGIDHRFWIRLGLVIMVVTGVAIAAGLAWVVDEHLPRERWLPWLGAPPILCGMWGMWAAFRQQLERLPYGLAACAIAMNLALFGFAASRIGGYQRCAELFEGDDTASLELASFGRLEPSWVYYSGRPVREFRVEDTVALSRFLSEHPRTGILVTDDLRERLESMIGPTRPLARVPYFLKTRELSLVRLATEKDRAQHTQDTAQGRKLPQTR